MWALLLLLILVAGVFAWLQFAKKTDESEEEIPVYVCPECGDHHCNCYLEQEVEKSRTEKRNNNGS